MMMIMNKTIDIFVAVDSNESAKVLNLEQTNTPIPTGNAVIRNMVNPKDNRFSGGASAPIKYFIENPVIIGRLTIDKMLITAVYDIDNAVSPLASFVIIFEVTPPGQDASIIIPTAISFVIPINEIIMNATRGSKNI
jgi:hypothetical protein